MIFIVLIFFIIYNFYKYNKEYFSNRYQDTDLRAKLSYHGTNLSPIKPLLTLYFDRREPNCKYFYDYFSTTFGGLKKGGNHNLRFQDTRFNDPSVSIYSGKSQPWNQLKKIYADNSTSSASPNPDKNYDIINNEFLTIEEIEVKDGHLYDFNNKPALKIEDDGYIEYDGIYSPNNRQIKATLDNIIKFINDTYEKYLEFDDKADFESYTGQLWNFNVPKLGYTNCGECSEYYKNN